jgi:hypothetical protein
LQEFAPATLLIQKIPEQFDFAELTPLPPLFLQLLLVFTIIILGERG